MSKSSGSGFFPVARPIPGSDNASSAGSPESLQALQNMMPNPDLPQGNLPIPFPPLHFCALSLPQGCYQLNIPARRPRRGYSSELQAWNVTRRTQRHRLCHKRRYLPLFFFRPAPWRHPKLRAYGDTNLSPLSLRLLPESDKRLPPEVFLWPVPHHARSRRVSLHAAAGGQFRRQLSHHPKSLDDDLSYPRATGERLHRGVFYWNRRHRRRNATRNERHAGLGVPLLP